MGDTGAADTPKNWATTVLDVEKKGKSKGKNDTGFQTVSLLWLWRASNLAMRLNWSLGGLWSKY